MKDQLELVAAWGVSTILTAAALFGFFPKFFVHLIVLIYPREHPRRRELLAEIEVIPYRERVTWVFGQCATALFDGVPARIRDVRALRLDQAGDKAEDRYEEPGSVVMVPYWWEGSAPQAPSVADGQYRVDVAHDVLFSPVPPRDLLVQRSGRVWRRSQG